MTTTTQRTWLDDVAPELVEVLANPADDVPRLIYADWLEERGEEERAEFIRVQVELATRHDPFDQRELRILNRSPAFLDFPGTQQDDFGWNGTGSTEIEYDSGVKTVFRRGFVAEVHAPLAVLWEHLPRLVRRHPIEVVRATDREPQHFAAVPNVWPEHWTWWQKQTDDSNDFLGEELIAFLEPGFPPQGEGGKGKNYPTADAAHAALSVALLKWAKGHPLTNPDPILTESSA